jgi:hypothetical protein
MSYYRDHEVALDYARDLTKEDLDIDTPPPYYYEERVAIYDNTNRIPIERRDAASNASLTQSIILGCVGFVSASGFSYISLQVALATLRIATMTAAAGAVGVGTIGTGYLVVEGGRLVLQHTKPGIIATLKAAAQVARDGREGCLTVYRRAEDGALTAIRGAQDTAQSAGNTVNRLSEAGRQELFQAQQALLAVLAALPGYGDRAGAPAAEEDQSESEEGQVEALEVEDEYMELRRWAHPRNFDEGSISSAEESDYSDETDDFVVVGGEDDRESFETARMELGVPA